MAKYDVDRFESPPDEDLICCICQCVLDNPLESPCRHVFCKVCIETWLTNRSNCPNCRKRLRVSKLKPVLPIVRNMINRLLIVCENREHGCTGGIKLEMYDKHLQNCDYAPIKCLNTGCGQTVLRRNMLAHEQTCKYRLIMCKKGCGLPISMEKLKKHNCLDELKKSMTAMEEQYKQRLLDLETKLNTKIQVLEDRIKAMEENCQQDYGSGWGSARDSYSSMAGFDESDSPSRDLEYTDIQDYEENNDDDSNSFYYSGNEDNDFESTPEYQEAQTYDVYSGDEQHRDEEPQEEEEEQEQVEEVEEEGGMDGGDSDTTFFLNSDVESSNGSEGDLNDSLLDSSSDAESIADDQEPVQVYEVSPTSPHSENDAHQEDSSIIEHVQLDEEHDSVLTNSPHSSTHRERSRRDQYRQTQDGQSGQPIGSHEEHRAADDEAANEGFYPRDTYDNEHSSLCSLRVEYGSSGRASPPEQEQEHGYVTDPEEGADVAPVVIEVDDSHSGDGRRQSDEASGRRLRSRENSRGHRRSSRSKRSHQSRQRDRTESSHESQRGQSTPPSSRNEQDSSFEGVDRMRTSRSGAREYFYGVPVDESDSSADPSWEMNSEDNSSDVSISDDSLLMYESFEDDDDYGSNSPEVYEKFLSSLHNVESSESDRTWVPGDQDSGDDVDPADNLANDADSDVSETNERSGSQEDSSQTASHRSSRTRSSVRTRSRPGDQSASDRDPTSRSSDSENVTMSRKRPVVEESSSESETGEDERQHPAWKRRR